MHTDVARLKVCGFILFHSYQWLETSSISVISFSIVYTSGKILLKQSVGILTSVFSFASWRIMSKATEVFHLANTDQMPGNHSTVRKCLTTIEMWRNAHRLLWSRNYRSTLAFWLGAKILTRGLIKSVISVVLPIFFSVICDRDDPHLEYSNEYKHEYPGESNSIHWLSQPNPNLAGQINWTNKYVVNIFTE